MLASPANQLSVADSQGQTANLLALDVSGTQHESVLLAPGKWSVGSAASNEIVLSDNGIAPRQFLIIVTKQRSVIKDWSGKALWNGQLFDDAVLGGGDTVQIANVRLTFRPAESVELISQLPCVAESGSHDEGPEPDVEPDTFALRRNPATDAIEVQEPAPENTNHEIADGMIVSDVGADRLDDLISRIESAGESEDSVPSTDFEVAVTSGNDVGGQEFDSEFTSRATEDSDVARESHSSLRSQATLIDVELRQLEELRAAVQLERAELLTKRAVLAQETARVTSELEAIELQEQSVKPTATAGSELDVDGVPDISDESAANSVDCSLHEPTCSLHEPTSSLHEPTSSLHEPTSSLHEPTSSLLEPTADDEEAAVTVEREKLRHYLEKFDSVDGTATDEAAEDEAVGAAQLVTDHSQTNMLRSREEAVKRLDELVLAATQSQDSNAPSITNNAADDAGNGSFFKNNDAVSSRDGHAFPIVEDLDESAPEPENVDIEASVEELEALIHEAEFTGSAFVSNEEANDLTSRETVLFSADQQGDTPVVDEAPADHALAVDEHWRDDRSLDHAKQTETVDAASGLYSAQPDSEQPADADSDETTIENTSDEFASDDTTSRKEMSQIESIFDDSQSGSVADSNSAVDSVQAMSEPQADSTPSWFDSNFITKDDSITGSSDEGVQGETEDTAVSDERQSEADIANDSHNTSSDDLRQKLAQMFDLPTLSENTEQAAAENSLQEHLQQFRDEDQPANTEPDDTVEQANSWGEPVVPEATLDLANEEAAAELSFDPLAVSDAESRFQYESETLDEFPSSANTDDSDDKPLSDTSSTFEPEVQDEAEESINAYMERLLARNRQAAGVSGDSRDADSSDDTSTASHKSSHKSAGRPDASPDEGSYGNGSKPETWLDDTPRHQQNRDQVRADVQVLRQIANQSARSAVATASRRDVRNQVLKKSTASILSLGTGVAALLMNVSLTIGLIFIGFGMFFSVDLTLTIFRNLMQNRKLRKFAAAIENASDANVD